MSLPHTNALNYGLVCLFSYILGNMPLMLENDLQLCLCYIKWDKEDQQDTMTTSSGRSMLEVLKFRICKLVCSKISSLCSLGTSLSTTSEFENHDSNVNNTE